MNTLYSLLTILAGGRRSKNGRKFAILQKEGVSAVAKVEGVSVTK
jgi:hypothetical protein